MQQRSIQRILYLLQACCSDDLKVAVIKLRDKDIRGEENKKLKPAWELDKERTLQVVTNTDQARYK